MNVKVKLSLMLLACVFAFYSCDKVKDATTTKIPVSSVSIELDEITVTGAKSIAEVLNSFSAEQLIKLSDLGLSGDAVKYSDKIKSVEVGGPTSVTITTTDSVGTVVQEFTLQATDVTTLNVPQYNLGTPHSGNDIQVFAQQLLTKLFANNSATVTASGKTDIISGEKLKIKIVVENITLIASLL
jgi:hypothetical protein